MNIQQTKDKIFATVILYDTRLGIIRQKRKSEIEQINMFYDKKAQELINALNRESKEIENSLEID